MRTFLRHTLVLSLVGILSFSAGASGNGQPSALTPLLPRPMVVHYAQAICALDARYVADNSEGISYEQVKRQFDQAAVTGRRCSGAEVIGTRGELTIALLTVNGVQHVYQIRTRDGKVVSVR